MFSRRFELKEELDREQSGMLAICCSFSSSSAWMMSMLSTRQGGARSQTMHLDDMGSLRLFSLEDEHAKETDYDEGVAAEHENREGQLEILGNADRLNVVPQGVSANEQKGKWIASRA